MYYLSDRGCGRSWRKKDLDSLEEDLKVRGYRPVWRTQLSKRAQRMTKGELVVLQDGALAGITSKTVDLRIPSRGLSKQAKDLCNFLEAEFPHSNSIPVYVATAVGIASTITTIAYCTYLYFTV